MALVVIIHHTHRERLIVPLPVSASVGVLEGLLLWSVRVSLYFQFSFFIVCGFDCNHCVCV